MDDTESLVKTKSATRIRQMFSDIAPTYDLLNHLLSLNIDKRWRRIAAQHVLRGNETQMLDVCCGTGDMALAFQRRAWELNGAPSLVLTDFTPEMSRIAARKLRDRAMCMVADTLSLPFGPGEFDVVSVAFGIRNVSDVQQALGEMSRVCKPGGCIAVLEFSQVKNRVLRAVYQAYFSRVLPLIGYAISRTAAYRYLPSSVGEFPEGEQFAALLREASGGAVETRPLTFGIATLYVARVKV